MELVDELKSLEIRRGEFEGSIEDLLRFVRAESINIMDTKRASAKIETWREETAKLDKEIAILKERVLA